MKRTIVALAGGLLLSGIAVAQIPPPPPPGGWDAGAFWRGAPDSPRERIRFLQDRIDRGRADGSLNPREAARAGRELDRIRMMDRRMHYDSGGRLDPRQRDMLQARLDSLSQQIRWSRHNGW